MTHDLGPPPTVPRATAANRAARPNLLVVDDDAIVRASIARFLRAESNRLLTASSLCEARRALSDADFVCDVAVVDLLLGDGWGLSLLPTLVDGPHFAAGLVAISGAARGPAGPASAFAAGAFDFLEKPFSSDDLSQAVNGAWLRTQRYRERRENAQSPGEKASASESADLDSRIACLSAEFLLDDDEREVVRLIACGSPDKHIASVLGRSLSAVKRTEAKIRRKLLVENRVGIVTRIYEERFSDG